MIDEDEDLPQAISGTLRTYSLLRDGTLRVVIDIDPRFKAGFHRLFPDNDIPVAIAPLALDFERREQEEKQKGGPLCRLAAMWCRDDEFRRWLAMRLDYPQDLTEDEAATAMRTMLGIESRVQLDHDTEAAGRFQTMIRAPFMEWGRLENGT